MFKRYFLTSAAAVVCATALTSAQTPTTGAAPQVPPAVQSARPSPQSTTTDRAAERMPMTITGCLVREQDIPGHAPNDADRAGRLEDFILTSASNAQAEAGKTNADASKPVGYRRHHGSADISHGRDVQDQGHLRHATEVARRQASGSRRVDECGGREGVEQCRRAVGEDTGRGLGLADPDGD